MGLFKGEKPNTKEFMKYEDGKIVSIEVEQAQKHKPVDHYPVEAEEKPQEPRINVVKRHITKKVMKRIALVVILILFAFALYDVYKAFFATTESSEQPTNPADQVVTTPGGGGGTPSNPETPTTPTTPTNPAEEDPKTETPNNGDNGNTVETPDVTEDSLAYLLSLTSQLNASMIQISSDELAYIGRYQERQANKIGLQKHLTSSQAEKEKLYESLANFKPLFVDEEIQALYTATENRLVASIQFTKDVNASFTGTASLSSLSENYVSADEALRIEQQGKLIDILNREGIAYRINEATKKVEYTITK